MTGPQLYRKLPVDVEARQVPVYDTADPIEVYLAAAMELAEWCGGDASTMMLTPEIVTKYETFEVTGPHLLIVTLEGPHAGLPGDSIIKGVEGEFYPCKRSVFEKTYAIVEADVEVIIYGASDDLVEVEGPIEGADEFNVYGPWAGILVAPNGDSLIVRAEFSQPKRLAQWTISIENTVDYPSWPVHFTERPDRDGDPALVVRVPAGTVLREVTA